jgi:hypothetical protein
MKSSRQATDNSGADKADQAQRIPLIDIVLINIPVILFAVLAILSLCVAFRLRFPLALIPVIIAWWSICGAVMLSIDFLSRKRSLYFRLRSPGPPAPNAPLARSLMQTLCGLSVYAAALRYSRMNRT